MDDLEIFFECNFIQNESHTDEGNTIISHYYLDHLPILEEMFSGLISINSENIQCFIVDNNGKFSFSKIGDPLIYVIDGELDLNSKLLKFYWNGNPGENLITVSYHLPKDYDMLNI